MEYFNNLNIFLHIKNNDKYFDIINIIESLKLNENLFNEDNFDNNLKIDIAIIEFYENINYEIFKKLNLNNSKIVILILENGIDYKIKSDILKYGIIYFFEINKPFKDLDFCILNHLNNFKYERINRDLSNFLFFQKKIFKIPNSLKFITPICDHLTRDLGILGIKDKDKILFIKFGIQEMLINAIEHGNLEITFDEKSSLLQDGIDITKVIENKANDKKYKDRKVTVEFIVNQKGATFIIKDCGKGFDTKKFIKEINDPSNISLEHGRGILLTKNHFDEFYYNKKGNKVTLILYPK